MKIVERLLFCAALSVGMQMIAVRVSADEAALPSNRLTVAVLGFEDQTDTSQSAHWRHSVKRLLSNQLREAKGIRVIYGSAVKSAYRELDIDADAVLDIAQARKLGEVLEARRVIWGNYRHEAKGWVASARVLNVASGEASQELIGVSENWFEIRDMLTNQILSNLKVKPCVEEQEAMGRYWTDSSEALNWWSQGYSLQEEKEPRSKQEECLRNALMEDTEFVEAHLGLSAILATQGRFEDAAQEARTALRIRHNNAGAHRMLGSVLMVQDRFAEAMPELREALQIDPDDAEALKWLGQIHASEGRWDEATECWERAQALNPMDATVSAQLGSAYVYKRDRARALAQVKEAERRSFEDLNAEQMIGRAYEYLGEIPQAIRHFERAVALGREEQMNPDGIAYMERQLRRLKATLAPEFVEATMPMSYNAEELQLKLQAILSADELGVLVRPLESTPDIKRWAEELTHGATNELAKAKALYDGLTRHIHIKSPHDARTARQVFASWTDPKESFNCQDYTKLYVTLARDVGIISWYVHVDKDYSGKAVPHDCAAVFIDGKVLLVDPTYRWFGVPHEDFVILNDLQAIAHHHSQGDVVVRHRLARKLDPESTWTRLKMVGALISNNQWDIAGRELNEALVEGTPGWQGYFLQGIVAGHAGDTEHALHFLGKAAELNPENSEIQYNLGVALLHLGEFEDAREAFRAALKHRPRPETAASARRRIVEINEILGAHPEDSGTREPLQERNS